MTPSVAVMHLLGSQTPRIRSVPSAVSYDRGDAAVELSALAGLHLDEWEALVLRESLGKAASGKHAAFEVGLVVARQNGKGSILEARQLAGLFTLHEPLQVHTSHQFKTTTEHFLRVAALIENTDALRKRCKKPKTSPSDIQIETLEGRRLKFVARSRSSARGFTGDTVYLDEAFELPDAAIAALMPTMAARSMTGNPQLWYTSSAVNQDEHPNGVVLARIRARGMRGGDPSLAYFEWSVDEDEFAEHPELALDPRAWALSNPGFGLRISEDHIAREQRSMSAKTFAVERLSVGDWPDPDATDSPLDLAQWIALADDQAPKPVAPVMFAVDMTPLRTRTSICVAGARKDGHGHVEVAENAAGTDWVVARCVELNQTYRPLGFVVDPRSPAGSLIQEMTDAGLNVITPSTVEVTQACGAFYDAVIAAALRHRNDPSLNQAVAGAATRPLGDAWAWARKATTTDISPLVAATLALWGWTLHRGAKGAPNLW